MNLRQPAQRRDDGDQVARPGHELEPGPGHHGQRALGAGQQRRVVIAGVVLDQAGQVRHDGAVRQRGLDAAQLGAHRAVAQDPQAAGVGGDGPADGGAAPAGNADAEVQLRVRVAGLRQGDSRTGRDLTGGRVGRAQLAQPAQAEHHLAVQRHAAADQPGVAALRDDGEPGAGAAGQDLRDLTVSRGRTTAGVWPANLPVQSTAKPAVASPVSTCCSPTMAASACRTAGASSVCMISSRPLPRLPPAIVSCRAALVARGRQARQWRPGDPACRWPPGRRGRAGR